VAELSEAPITAHDGEATNRAQSEAGSTSIPAELRSREARGLVGIPVDQSTKHPGR